MIRARAADHLRVDRLQGSTGEDIVDAREGSTTGHAVGPGRAPGNVELAERIDPLVANRSVQRLGFVAVEIAEGQRPSRAATIELGFDNAPLLRPPIGVALQPFEIGKRREAAERFRRCREVHVAHGQRTVGDYERRALGEGELAVEADQANVFEREPAEQREPVRSDVGASA